jgi:hypothetical protein
VLRGLVLSELLCWRSLNATSTHVADPMGQPEVGEVVSASLPDRKDVVDGHTLRIGMPGRRISERVPTNLARPTVPTPKGGNQPGSRLAECLSRRMAAGRQVTGFARVTLGLMTHSMVNGGFAAAARIARGRVAVVRTMFSRRPRTGPASIIKFDWSAAPSADHLLRPVCEPRVDPPASRPTRTPGRRSCEACLARRAPPLKTLFTRDSKTTTGIQVADVLLGAAMADWQQDASSDAKGKIRAGLAEHLGSPDPRANTLLREFQHLALPRSDIG